MGIAVVVASFGKVFVLLHMVWGSADPNAPSSVAANYAVHAFVYTSHVIGVKAALQERRWFPAPAIVVLGILAQRGAGHALGALGAR